MTELKKLVPKRNYWKQEEEDLLKNWAEKAKCYHWLHNKSREIYQRKNAWFTIPVIIISTIVGTANFAQDRFTPKYKNYVVMIIGTLSIFAGIVTTVSQFLKIGEFNEAHRVSALSWGKFFRNIKTELSRHPRDRFPPIELIKMCKEEFDRLIEISPFIPKSVVSEFNRKFGKNENLTKPEICDIINSTEIFEISNEEREQLRIELIPNNKLIYNNSNNNDTNNFNDNDNEKINKFKDTFFSLNGIYPNDEEIQKHLKKFTSNNDNSSSNISICIDTPSETII